LKRMLALNLIEIVPKVRVKSITDRVSIYK
jgi:hypothetical protein